MFIQFLIQKLKQEQVPILVKSALSVDAQQVFESVFNPFNTIRFQKIEPRRFFNMFFRSKIIQTSFSPISIALEIQEIVFVIMIKCKI